MPAGVCGARAACADGTRVVLNDKPEHGAGSQVEQAWDRMDEIIEMLDDADALRFLKGAPVSSRLSTLVLAHRYRWSAPSQKPVALSEL